MVALSGTPVINRPHEIAFLMNLLRGPIQRIVIPVKAIPTWDEERMMSLLREVPDVDTVEFNSVKKYILVTRNPPHFRSVYNDKGDLKIDHTFTASMLDDPKRMVMLRSIVRLVKQLELELVVEGVESCQQRDLLMEIGCDLAQGYLFGAPAPVDRILSDRDRPPQLRC